MVYTKHGIPPRLVFGILIIVLLIGAVGCRQESPDYPQATAGVLDLTGWDFEQKGPLPLDGEWEFYWQELLEPRDFVAADRPPEQMLMTLPRSWNGYEVYGQSLPGEGYATFRLKVLLPEQKRPTSVDIPSIYTSHKCWVNGQLVSVQGRVATQREGSEAKHYPRIIPLDLQEQEMELVIQVSNFSHRRGGIWKSLTFGYSEDIMAARERQTVVDMFLMGSLVIMGFYHLSFFLLRRQQKALLFFALFCLLIGLRVSLVGQIMLLNFLPGLSQETVLKLEYFTYYLSLPLLFWYLHCLYPEEVSAVAVKAYSLVAALYTFQVLVTSGRVYSQYLYSFNVFTVVFLIFSFFAVVLAAYRKKRDAWLVIVAFLVFGATTLNDVLYYMEISPIRDIAPVGVIIFIFVQAFILSRRFATAFETVEDLSKKLLEADKVKDRYLKQMMTAELRYLQAQIKPHFIFNALNVVIALCRHDPPKAAELLSDLSNYLQAKFTSAGMDTLIPLSKELDLVQSYLSIEQARFQDRLQVRYRLAADLETEIPPLTLQPLVENAVKHGVFPKLEGGTVEIAIWEEEETVVIQVKDDGVGMTGEKLAGIFEEHGEYKGIGILNVHKRLLNYYGTGLFIQSKPDQGTVVTFRIPRQQVIEQ